MLAYKLFLQKFTLEILHILIELDHLIHIPSLEYE